MNKKEEHSKIIVDSFKRHNQKYRTRFVRTGAGRVHFFEYEGGDYHTPIVFLHGWGANAHSWFPVLDEFRSQKVRHILIDLPGFGKSTTPEEVYGVDDYAGIVEEVVEQLDISSFVLVGHSFGGQVATKYAHEYSERVEKLVLVNAASIRTRRKRAREWFAGILKPVFTLPFLRPIGDTILSNVVGLDYKTNPDLYETMKKVISEDLSDLLPEIKQPTLIVWGADDSITPLSQAYALDENIPHSLLTVIPDATHYSFLDDPNEFQRGLWSFIKNAE